jgi:hypothetical protein
VELLLQPGIEVSHEILREYQQIHGFLWNAPFADSIALELKRYCARPGKIWHLDEMRVVVRGTVMWLWRAVDEHGQVLDSRDATPTPRNASSRIRGKKKQRVSRGGHSPPDALEGQLRCRDFVRKVFKRKRGTAGAVRGGWRSVFRV